MLHIIKAPSLPKLERVFAKLGLSVESLSVGHTDLASPTGIPCSTTVEYAAHPVPHYVATLLTGRDALANEIARAGSVK